MRSNDSSRMTELPQDVLAALEQAVKECGTQRVVANRLGISNTVVNQLLRGRYMGDVEKQAERIRGEFMSEFVTCPVMGQLGRQHCLEYQTRPLVMTNPLRVALHRACPTCPNKRKAS